MLGPKTGRLEELVREGEKVTGIKTADGRTHDADLVIVACGPWTPSIVQETNGSLEATGGSVVTITLPKERKDLWEKVRARTSSGADRLSTLRKASPFGRTD